MVKQEVKESKIFHSLREQDGCPIQAIVHAFGLDERTLADWRDRAGVHCQKVHQEREHLLNQALWLKCLHVVVAVVKLLQPLDEVSD